MGKLHLPWLAWLVALFSLARGLDPPAQDSTSCAGGQFTGLKLEGRILRGPSSGPLKPFVNHFEVYYLNCGVVTVAESQPGVREVFLLVGRSDSRYAVGGWDPVRKQDSFLLRGIALRGPEAGVAVPMRKLWLALERRNLFLECLEVHSDSGGCELVTRELIMSQHVSQVRHRFSGGRYLGSETVLESPDGTEQVIGEVSVQGSLEAAPWLPSRVESRTYEGDKAILKETWIEEISKSERIDPAMDCASLFEKLTAGMVEIRPGQRYLGPDKGIATIDGEPIAGTPAGGGGLSAWWTRNRVFVLSCAVVLALAFGARRLLEGRTRRRRG